MEKILRETLPGGAFQKIAPVRSSMMKAVKGQGNITTEMRFCDALLAENIPGWEKHPKMLGNPDLFFPCYQIVIFLDGCFWHACPDCGHVPKTHSHYWQMKLARTQERDQQKRLALAAQGYTVLQFWEHAILSQLSQCIDSVKEAIESFFEREN